jgi:arylsulfatase A-like enzyme
MVRSAHSSSESELKVFSGNANVPLRPEDVTVAEVLGQAGYRTALLGTWGLGNPNTTGVPLNEQRAMQFMKQVFDIGELFNTAGDLAAVALDSRN